MNAKWLTALYVTYFPNEPTRFSSVDDYEKWYSMMPLFQSLFFDGNFSAFTHHLSSLAHMSKKHLFYSELARAFVKETGTRPRCNKVVSREYVKDQTFVEKAVLHLLEKGADPNALDMEDSPVSLFMDLLSIKSLKVVKKCIEMGGDVNDYMEIEMYNYKETLLDVACRTTGEIVRFLLENGAMKTFIQNPPKLNIAIEHGTLEILQILVEKGIKPKLSNIEDCFDILLVPDFASKVYKSDAAEKLIWLLSKTWDALDFQRIQKNWEFYEPKPPPWRKEMALQIIKDFIEQRRNFYDLFLQNKTVSNLLMPR